MHSASFSGAAFPMGAVSVQGQGKPGLDYTCKTKHRIWEERASPTALQSDLQWLRYTSAALKTFLKSFLEGFLCENMKGMA